MRSKAEKPEWEPYFIYLDELRESGETNMYEAPPYLMDAFVLDKELAIAILAAWMNSFSGATRKVGK